MPRQRTHHSRITHVVPADFPERLRRFKEAQLHRACTEGLGRSGSACAMPSRHVSPDLRPSRRFPAVPWRWWKAGVRPGQHHLKALLDLVDNLGLGHLFTERGCMTAGSKTQTGPNTCTAGDDAATDVAFSPVLALQRHVAQLHHSPFCTGAGAHSDIEGSPA